MKTIALTTFLALASLTRADTVIQVDDTVLRAGVQLLLKEDTASAKGLVERLVVVPKGKGAK